MMEDVLVNLSPGLLWQKLNLTRRECFFTRKMNLELRKKLVNCYIWSTALYGAKTWTWKVLKCGAGEGWRRSAGPIM
jgi:hypothetical protein